MKCPHCCYQDGYDIDTEERIYGRSGSFYKLPVKLERENKYDTWRSDIAIVYGCPSCFKLFAVEV